MKTVKLLIVLVGFTLMGTGCRHEHNHDEKSLKKVDPQRSHQATGKTHENHRH